MIACRPCARPSRLLPVDGDRPTSSLHSSSKCNDGRQTGRPTFRWPRGKLVRWPRYQPGKHMAWPPRPPRAGPWLYGKRDRPPGRSEGSEETPPSPASMPLPCVERPKEESSATLHDHRFGRDLPLAVWAASRYCSVAIIADLSYRSDTTSTDVGKWGAGTDFRGLFAVAVSGGRFWELAVELAVIWTTWLF